MVLIYISMFQAIKEIFSKNRVSSVFSVDENAARVMKDISEYYLDFERKLKVFSEIKKTIIDVKSQIYDFEQQQQKEVSNEICIKLQKQVDTTLAHFKAELVKIKSIVKIQKELETDEEKYALDILEFIDTELAKDIPPEKWKYKQTLSDLKKFLLGARRDSVGIFHLLANQLALLKDIENAEKELEIDIKKSGSKQSQLQEKLVRTLKILELESMRFWKYCAEEADIIKPGVALQKNFVTEYATLRSLGLVYTEPALTTNNLGIITTKIRLFGKNIYGVKGVGVIHEDNRIDFRFVKGSLERHAEIVQMLFEGIPGRRLSDDAVVAYLHALPLGKITKIAGYELQLVLDEEQGLKIININYASTILEIQVERRTNTLSGEFLAITKKDFDRLNYSLLYSINKELLDKKEFEMRIAQKGNKIIVTDKRIYPLRGE